MWVPVPDKNLESWLPGFVYGPNDEQQDEVVVSLQSYGEELDETLIEAKNVRTCLCPPPLLFQLRLVWAHSRPTCFFHQLRKVDKKLLLIRNPSIQDNVDDLTTLSYMHDPAILHALNLRYSLDMIYSYSGPILIAGRLKIEIFFFSLTQKNERRGRGARKNRSMGLNRKSSNYCCFLRAQ